MTCPAAGRGNGATGAQEPAQGHTARLAATLERIAALHSDLAAAYRELAADTADIQLADSGPSALMDAVPTASATPGPGKLLTSEQMAELLSVSERTVRRWEAEGLIPRALRLANVLRWDAAIVERWLASEAGR